MSFYNFDEDLPSKVFDDSEIMNQSANFGWQDKNAALYGLREGYKNSADDLVEIVLSNPDNIKKLDTYFFPIMFSYRHSLELALKHIYLRATDKLPKGGHNLLTLWDKVKEEIIDGMLDSKEFIKSVRSYKPNLLLFSHENLNFGNFRSLLVELQRANQLSEEIRNNNSQLDQNADVWRYLISTDNQLYFKCSHSVDYINLRKTMDYMYSILDYIYDRVSDYLSS